MNPAQKARVLEIVRADAEIVGKYHDVFGQTCAIGGLLKAAGLLSLVPAEHNSSHLSDYELRGAVQALMREYGLDLTALLRIQMLNDSTPITALRRTMICDYVEAL